jgi:hypothetical protein
MNDPKRLLDEGANDIERELLGTWLDEKPSKRARAAVMGLAVGAGLGAATTTAAATASAGAAPKTAAAIGAWALGKWVLVGALSGLVTVGTVEVAAPLVMTESAAAPSITAPERAPAIATVRAPEAKTAGVEAPTPPLPAEAPKSSTPTLADSASARQAPSAHAVASAESAESTPEKTKARCALREEATLIEQALSAVRSSRGGAALTILDDYQLRCPGGTLQQEATVLRMEALVASGRRSEASSLGRAFVSAYPESSHISRIHALLGDLTKP